MLVLGYVGVMFGGIDQHGAVAGLSARFVALFEFSLGVWLIVKGFDPDAVAALETADEASVHLSSRSNPLA